VFQRLRYSWTRLARGTSANRINHNHQRAGGILNPPGGGVGIVVAGDRDGGVAGAESAEEFEDA